MKRLKKLFLAGTAFTSVSGSMLWAVSFLQGGASDGSVANLFYAGVQHVLAFFGHVGK